MEFLLLLLSTDISFFCDPQAQKRTRVPTVALWIKNLTAAGHHRGVGLNLGSVQSVKGPGVATIAAQIQSLAWVTSICHACGH